MPQHVAFGSHDHGHDRIAKIPRTRRWRITRYAPQVTGISLYLSMGTHGRRGLSRMVMGSDAEGVMRGASVPVVLLKAK